jgi:FKBP-type peptidyl-prolyl cis-trans isomerase
MIRIIFAALVVITPCAFAQTKSASPTPVSTPKTDISAPQLSLSLKDQKDKVSYSIGLDIGQTFKKQNIEVNSDSLSAGIRDGISGKAQMTDEQVKETMAQFQKDMTSKQAEKSKETSAAGEKFLAQNKSKPGVKTTASGLQYKVITEGKGAQPKASDTVQVHYRGTLLDGTEFDSSYKRNEPATFPLNQVIKGWTEGVQLMKEGSKYEFWIPANLAYGDRQVGPQIPPGSTLHFEVELLKVLPPQPASTPAAK